MTTIAPLASIDISKEAMGSKAPFRRTTCHFRSTRQADCLGGRADFALGHHRTHAPQQTAPVFNHLVSAGEE